MTHPVAAIQALERACASRAAAAREIAATSRREAEEEAGWLVRDARQAGRAEADATWERELAAARVEGERVVQAAREQAARIRQAAPAEMPEVIRVMVRHVLPEGGG